MLNEIISFPGLSRYVVWSELLSSPATPHKESVPYKEKYRIKESDVMGLRNAKTARNSDIIRHLEDLVNRNCLTNLIAPVTHNVP